MSAQLTLWDIPNAISSPASERAESQYGSGLASPYRISEHAPGPVNGFWASVDWLFCRDGKWRPTESIDVEMVDGLAHRLGYSRFADTFSLNPLKETEKEDLRVGRLRGYGNAVNAEQARAFIAAAMPLLDTGV